MCSEAEPQPVGGLHVSGKLQLASVSARSHGVSPGPDAHVEQRE
jgi:hypothetical protein